MPGSRKLGRSSDHRKAMLRAMVTFLLENGKIETTVTRAKEVRAMTEKMITLGKSNNLHSKRQVLAYVTKEGVAKKVFDEIAPKYADKNGGYTRIIKIAPRRCSGDGNYRIGIMQYKSPVTRRGFAIVWRSVTPDFTVYNFLIGQWTAFFVHIFALESPKIKRYNFIYQNFKW